MHILSKITAISQEILEKKIWFAGNGKKNATLGLSPPLEINEGVFGEQDSLNTIFNTYKIKIVCKIWSSYFIVHACARTF